MTGFELVERAKTHFRTPAYKHQVEDSARLIDHDAFGLFSEMGVGKSRTVIDAACVLSLEERISTVLVISPAAVRSVWINPEFGEIRKHSWVANRVLEFHKPLKIIWSDAEPKLNWVVTNYEYLRQEKHQEELLALLHNEKVLMVLDESSFIKNRNAAQTKACLRIGKTVARRVVLNGTPISNNPLDLWSQVNFLNSRILPYKNFYHFRSEFAELGGWHNKQILRFKNLDRLQAHLAPYVIRREKKDCLDLPEKIFTQQEVALSESTWDKYKAMRDEAVVWMNENPSMAAQAGVRVMRLSQLTSGFLGGFIDASETEVDEDIPIVDGHERAGAIEEIGREKLDLLREWVGERLEENPSMKIIVWCRFRPELERVARDLKDLLPTYRLYGQAKKERAEAIARFSDVSIREPGLLAAQSQAGGFGLNLVAAEAVVYLSNTYSLMNRLQSEDRVHRPGQKKNVVYLDVIATGPKGQKTVDHAILKRLREKNEIATWTVAAWKQILEEE